MSKRGYAHISKLKEEILGMREKGATLRGVAERFGFEDKYVVKEFLKRERRKECKQEGGILLAQRGRSQKRAIFLHNEN